MSIFVFMQFYKVKSIETLTTVFEGVEFSEEWRRMAEFSGWYAVSSFGRFKRLRRKKKSTDDYWDEAILCQSENKYLKFKGKNSHRFVAKYFCENPLKKPMVNHLDSDKYNNFFKNLEWCTPSENNQHAVENSRCYQKRLRHLTYADRLFIKSNILVIGREELAAKFKITVKQVYFVGTNRDTEFMDNISLSELGVRKKHKPCPPRHKPIIDLNTGIYYTSTELANLLNTEPRYIRRILNEEKKPNATQFRYA